MKLREKTNLTWKSRSNYLIIIGGLKNPATYKVDSLRQYLINSSFQLLTILAKNSTLDVDRDPASPSKQNNCIKWIKQILVNINDIFWRRCKTIFVISVWTTFLQICVRGAVLTQTIMRSGHWPVQEWVGSKIKFFWAAKIMESWYFFKKM